VVAKSRREYIYPATHYASTTPATQTNVPAMGQRLRLKSTFVIPTNWTKQEKAVLLALKKYGALVADNGNFFSISVTPDDRWPAGCFDHLSTVGITNFEAIQATGPIQGPRSTGAPTAYAGPDQIAFVGVPVSLLGFVSATNTFPTTNLWKRYSGPTNVAFLNAALTNSAATFSAPGVYTLMLSASNGVHAVAFDAVVMNVMSAITLSLSRAGDNVNLSWTGGSPPFVLERSATLPAGSWSGVPRRAFRMRAYRLLRAAHSSACAGTEVGGEALRENCRQRPAAWLPVQAKSGLPERGNVAPWITEPLAAKIVACSARCLPGRA